MGRQVTTWYAVHFSYLPLAALLCMVYFLVMKHTDGLLCIYFMHFQCCGIMKLVEMSFAVVLYAFSTLTIAITMTITGDT
jgi:hypothetical protein